MAACGEDKLKRLRPPIINSKGNDPTSLSSFCGSDEDPCSRGAANSESRFLCRLGGSGPFFPFLLPVPCFYQLFCYLRSVNQYIDATCSLWHGTKAKTWWHFHFTFVMQRPRFSWFELKTDHRLNLSKPASNSSIFKCSFTFGRE